MAFPLVMGGGPVAVPRRTTLRPAAKREDATCAGSLEAAVRAPQLSLLNHSLRAVTRAFPAVSTQEFALYRLQDGKIAEV
jgi:hypothetical protein